LRDERVDGFPDVLRRNDAHEFDSPAEPRISSAAMSADATRGGHYDDRNPEEARREAARLRWQAAGPEDVGAAWELFLLFEDEIRAEVRSRLGDALRQFVDSGDVVQEVALSYLRSRPRFIAVNLRQFRAFLKRIIANKIAGLARTHKAGDPSIQIDPEPDWSSLTDSETSVSTKAEKAESAGRLRAAIDLLPVEDQLLIQRRQEGVAFAAIAAELGVSVDAATKRHSRIRGKIERLMERLRAGVVPQDGDADLD
jgi:RNA polymerase sigma factor (sigma-70 family)